MTRQRYENILRSTRYDIFLRPESERELFSSLPPLARRRFRLPSQPLLSPFNTVFSVCVVPFRHRSLAKRNGAFAVRYCLHLRVTRFLVNACTYGQFCLSLTTALTGLPVCRQSLRYRDTECRKSLRCRDTGCRQAPP